MKSRKLKAASVLGNQAATASATVTASSTSPVTLASTPIVETIASLAVKPESEAATDCQLPKPSGMKSGAMAPPILARRLAELSSTMPKPLSVNPNPPRIDIV